MRQRFNQVNEKAEVALARNQQLEESAAKAQESFRVELDSARRLCDLHKQSADTVKARLNEVQLQLDHQHKEAAQQLGRIQAELETERASREAADAKVSALELRLEDAESQFATSRPLPASRPGTPLRGMNGSLSTPGRAGSPATFSPGSARGKGAMTATALYAENTQLNAELVATRRRNEELRKTVDEMYGGLERYEPELEELRAANDRMATEVSGMSTVVEEATRVKDSVGKQNRQLVGEKQGVARECDILRQQLRDLSSQLKMLLVENQALSQGLESLSFEDQQYLAKSRAARSRWIGPT